MARSICKSCERPSSVCLCEAISLQENTIPVLIFRHEDEVSKSLNTAKLLKQSLSQVEIWDGVSFSESLLLSWLEQNSLRAPALLYPKQFSSASQHYVLSVDQAVILKQDFRDDFSFDIDSLIVLDGTWRNSRELIIVNEWLKKINTVSLEGSEPSRYLIRQSRKASSLSTIEAVGHVMGVIDRNVDLSRLLKPFHKMVQYQIDRMGADTFRRNYLKD